MNDTKYIYVYIFENIFVLKSSREHVCVFQLQKNAKIVITIVHVARSRAYAKNCFASKLSFRFAGFDSPFHSQRKKQGITKLINTGRICENCFPSG